MCKETRDRVSDLVDSATSSFLLERDVLHQQRIAVGFKQILLSLLSYLSKCSRTETHEGSSSHTYPHTCMCLPVFYKWVCGFISDMLYYFTREDKITSFKTMKIAFEDFWLCFQTTGTYIYFLLSGIIHALCKMSS